MGASRSAEPEFFEGFAWAVPLAFANAVAAYRFEPGDVLYRERSAYRPLSGAPFKALLEGGVSRRGGGRKGSSSGRSPDGAAAQALRAIQVLDPPGRVRTASGEFDGEPRRANWQSPVRVALVDLVSGRSEVRVLTQGRLLMALWKGEESWLEDIGSEAQGESRREVPAMPRSARELAQNLEVAAGAFAPASGAHGCRFLFVVDLASDASRAKAGEIEAALRATGPVECSQRTPAQTSIEDPETYHPALVIRALLLPEHSLESATAVLRDCLYGGGRSTAIRSDTESEGELGAADDEDAAGRDRFSVARHGLLEPLVPAPG